MRKLIVMPSHMKISDNENSEITITEGIIDNIQQIQVSSSGLISKLPLSQPDILPTKKKINIMNFKKLQIR
jgi:hypothetical protein